MKKYILNTALVALFLALGVSAPAQAAAVPVTGWAWSSTIGWISFSSTNPTETAGGAYGVSIDSATADFSGYAWSSNIGWISFNAADLAGCPGINPAHLDISDGSVTGWIRAVRGKDASVIAGGWDGCIELSGTNHLTGTPYISGNGGVTYDDNSGNPRFVGYAWGGPVVGWFHFYDVKCPACTSVTPVVVAASIDLKVVDPDLGVPSTSATVTLPPPGGSVRSVQVQWTAKDISSCSLVGPWPAGKGPAGSADVTDGAHPTPAQFLSFTTAGTRTLSLSCLDTATPTKNPVDSNTVTITVNPYTPPANLPCIQPAHANACTPWDTYNKGPDAPTGERTNVVDACIVNPGPAKYCTYTCAPGFRKSGNLCVASQIGEQ